MASTVTWSSSRWTTSTTIDVVRAYDRGERLQQRIKLMTWWGEQLAEAQRAADVVP